MPARFAALRTDRAVVACSSHSLQKEQKMLELLIAILLATGCPVPPDLIKMVDGTTITTQGNDTGDSGGDIGHIPLPPPPPPSGH